MSNSYPCQLSPGSEVTRGRPAVPADSDPGPRSCGVDKLSRPTRSQVELPRGRPAVPAESDLGPRCCGVDKHSRLTRSQV